jgi:hypothetical protein
MRKIWLFVEDLVDLVVQLARRLQIVAERLLDNRPHPVSPFFGFAIPCAPRRSMMSAKYSGAVAR